MRRLKTILTPTLAAGVLCAASSGQALGASVPTKAAFVARADAYCRVVEPKIDAISDRLNRESVSQAPKTIDAVAGVEARALRHLRALAEPAGAHTVLSKVWNSYGSLISYTRDVATDLRADEPRQANHDAGAASIAQARYRGLAQGYGFNYCGAGKTVG